MAPKPQKSVPQAIPPFALRMPHDMRQRLEDLAEKAGRSLNAEIVSRLEGSLLADDETASAIASHTEQLSDLDAAREDHDRRIEKLESRISDLMLMIRGDERRD